MTDSQETGKPPTVGELFSRQYLERGAPLQDNKYFRNRLAAYLKIHHDDYWKISRYLQQEAGIRIPQHSGPYRALYDFDQFFFKERVELILDAITLIWRWFNTQNTRIALSHARDWHAFVARALREENMAYTLDDKCGVHFFVDEEFERNRVTALACLAPARYAAVRNEFEQAHKYLDAQPPDTKGSIRSAFEALEILARRLAPESKNLNRWLVENKLLQLVKARTADPTESEVIENLFAALARTVDGLHLYRHGQNTEEPVAPSLTLAVYVLSIVAATLRWLVEVDSAPSLS